MFGSGRPSILFSTLKVAIVVGALSYVAADMMSNGFDSDGLARIAAAQTGADGPRAEPLITGSLGDLVRDARLDPCGDDRTR